MYLDKIGHHGHDRIVVGFTTTQSIPINTIVVSLNLTNGEVYLIQLFVINFVSYLQQVSVFLWVLRFPPPIKLTFTI